MDVADDVEGAREVPEVVVALLAYDLGAVGLLDAAQDVHLAEALALQVTEGAPQFAGVPGDDAACHAGAVGALRVARGADLLGDVEDDGDGQHVVLPCQVDQLLAALLLDVGRVDDGEPPGREALARDVVEHVERVAADALVVLVVGDEPSAEVAGDDLGGLEVPPRERRLAGPRGADEDDERQVGDGERTSVGTGGGHAAFASFGLGSVRVWSVRVKTAICVGGPTSGSSGPTGSNSTP